MPNILNNFSRSHRAFRPETVSEFLALQLARKLGAPVQIAPCLEAVNRFPLAAVVRAYRKARKQKGDQLPRIEAFERALPKQDDTSKTALPTSRLCAIKARRREISVAVFSGLKLDFVQERHLSADLEKAEVSALGFLNWVVSNLEADSAALERITSSRPIRSLALSRTALSTLRAVPLPVWQMDKEALLKRFALPPPKTRKEVRRIVRNIWPILNDLNPSEGILDAVALGLAVQAERLLS